MHQREDDPAAGPSRVGPPAPGSSQGSVRRSRLAGRLDLGSIDEDFGMAKSSANDQDVVRF